MALKLLFSGEQPIGMYDGLDTEVLTLKGGEVVTFTSTAYNSGDLAAADAFDGYVNPNLRPVVTRTLVKGAAGTGSRPLMLADEGIAGYGTLFGSVVGGTVGQVTTGTVLGPSTATGSGKVTCWAAPGMYAVTLDTVDSTTIVPTNPALVPGVPLYAICGGGVTGGYLTTTSSNNTPIVGTFVDFEDTMSLVTSQSWMTSIAVSATHPTRTPTMAVFYFNPPSA
jgi:hypothetical protein